MTDQFLVTAVKLALIAIICGGVIYVLRKLPFPSVVPETVEVAVVVIAVIAAVMILLGFLGHPLL